MHVPSPSDRIYACTRQFTMNLRYAFNNCAFARVPCTYVLSNGRIYAINYAYKGCVNVPIFTKTDSFTRIFPPGWCYGSSS